jgi:hypothetical protein
MAAEEVRRTARREGMTGGARKNNADATNGLYHIHNYDQVITISGLSASGCGNGTKRVAGSRRKVKSPALQPKTGHPSRQANYVRATRPQLTRAQDAICFFVAFSLTDFVSCGFASVFFSSANIAKNAASGFFSLGMFHQSLIASYLSSFPPLPQPQPSGCCVGRFVGHQQPERTAFRQPRRT